MTRYMLRLSYLGTRYRGSQKHSGSTVLDVDSIQGSIEASLLRMKSVLVSSPKVVLAGRTDAGVHALNTAAHVDLEHKYGNNFCTDSMVRLMNRYFIGCGHDIRIFSSHPVSNNFHARFSAISRTYIYRVVVAKDPSNHKFPISESHRSFFARLDKFDYNKVKEGVKLLNGTRDFTTFSSKKGKRPTRWKFDEAIDHRNFVRTVRTVNIRVEEGQPLMASDPLSSGFDYWNVICHSKSFMYNQVRRMVASLVGIGCGRLSLDELKIMLQVPSYHHWPSKIPPAPPFGLYLSNVEYDDEKTKEINT